MNAAQKTRVARWKKYLRTLERSAALLSESFAAGCPMLEQINAEALKSNAECQKLVKLRITMETRNGLCVQR